MKKAYETKEVETIQPALDKINEAWKAASEEMYKAQAEAQQAEGAPAGDAGAQGEATEENSDVEDVDFDEVK